MRRWAICLDAGRFPDEEVQKNLERQMENVRKAMRLGAHIGLGSDAGAYLFLMEKEPWMNSITLQRLV